LIASHPLFRKDLRKIRLHVPGGRWQAAEGLPIAGVVDLDNPQKRRAQGQ